MSEIENPPAGDSLPGAYAFGEPTLTGVLRREPADFTVHEELGFEPSDDGPHALLYVEKTGLTTLDLIETVARHARTRPREIGYCGLKDRHAVTRQWLSLPLVRASGAESWEGENWRVVEARRNRRKLKLGAHRRNRFALRIVDIQGDADDLARRIEQARTVGVPNYFGAQRFGHQGDNLRRARRWFVDGIELNRRQRRFALSAARSWLFNRVLSARVVHGSWTDPMPGEPLCLDGSRSFFHPGDDEVETLATRLAAFDVHPSGPLLGSGPTQARGQCAQFEQVRLDELSWVAQGLADVGLRQERRALRLAVADLRANHEGQTLELSFALNKGTFATAVVHELVRVNGGQIYA